MWGLFGDRTSGPPGTYYWRSSVTSNHHWHILDQVLLRPSLADKLTRLKILRRDGPGSADNSLLDKHGLPEREGISDHLPLLFELDI
jgi:hypothetical protein